MATNQSDRKVPITGSRSMPAHTSRDDHHQGQREKDHGACQRWNPRRKARASGEPGDVEPLGQPSYPLIEPTSIPFTK